MQLFLCARHYNAAPADLRQAFAQARNDDKLRAALPILEWTKGQPREIESRRNWPSAG